MREGGLKTRLCTNRYARKYGSGPREEVEGAETGRRGEGSRMQVQPNRRGPRAIVYQHQLSAVARGPQMLARTSRVHACTRVSTFSSPYH